MSDLKTEQKTPAPTLNEAAASAPRETPGGVYDHQDPNTKTLAPAPATVIGSGPTPPPANAPGSAKASSKAKLKPVKPVAVQVKPTPLAVFASEVAQTLGATDALSYANSRKHFEAILRPAGFDVPAMEELRREVQADLIDFSPYEKARITLDDVKQIVPYTGQRKVIFLLRVSPDRSAWSKVYPGAAVLAPTENEVLLLGLDWNALDEVVLITGYGFTNPAIEAWLAFHRLVGRSPEVVDINQIPPVPAPPSAQQLQHAESILKQAAMAADAGRYANKH